MLHDIPGDLVTPVQAIVVESDLMYNTLIDQSGIERIVLVSDELEVLTKYKENLNGQDRLLQPLRRYLITV